MAVPMRMDIEVTRGDDADFTLIWDGMDLTDYTIYLTMRDTLHSQSLDDTDAVLQILADIEDAANGQFNLHFDKTATIGVGTFDHYWHDIQATAPDGYVTTIAHGWLYVGGDVTKRSV